MQHTFFFLLIAHQDYTTYAHGVYLGKTNYEDFIVVIILITGWILDIFEAANWIILMNILDLEEPSLKNMLNDLAG